MKVYCTNCNKFSVGIFWVCKRNPPTIENVYFGGSQAVNPPFKMEMYDTDYREVNKNNDCPHYKAKKVIKSTRSILFWKNKD